MTQAWLGLAWLSAWLVLSIAAATTAAQSTAAQSTTAHPPNGVERAAARSQMAEGVTAERKRDWTRAEIHYRAAHDTMHLPTTGLALARVLVEQGSLLDAGTVALASAHLPVRENEPDVVRAARLEAKKLAAALRKRTPTLQLLITPATANPVVRIDGRVIGSQLFSGALPMDPGLHLVVVQAPGFVETSLEVRLTEAAREIVPVTLLPLSTSDREDPLPRPFGATTAADPTDPRVVRGWAALGVGTAAAAVGAVAGMMVLKQSSAIQERCGGSVCQRPAWTAIKGDLSGARTLSWVSTVSLPVGLLAIGYGLYELLLNRPDEDSKTTAFIRAAPQTLQVAGQF